jgi:glucose/arabinose dehydrogenase
VQPARRPTGALTSLLDRRRLGSVAAASLALMLAVVACESGESSTPDPATSPTPPPATVTPGVSPTSPVDGTPSPDISPLADRPDFDAVDLELTLIASGFDDPLGIEHAGDGSGRLFVLERGGRIRIVRDGQVAQAPFLDIADRVTAGGERGLLGLAFPPGFGSEREEIYVHYSDRSGDTTISSFRVPDGGDAADPASERVILRVGQPYANHNGGAVVFDADGMLLVALGDGGSGGDPENRAERLDTLLGKLLRIDVLGAPGGEAYGIPSDNPFVDRAEARPEILHYGLRNPWRMSLDPPTGDLWIADVGQNRWEEVNVARAGERGLDFGWNTLEGRHCFDPPQGCSAEGTRLPVAEYGHDQGCSVTGGYVYRGESIPALRGAYVFSDYCSGLLFAIYAGGPEKQAPVTLLESDLRVSSFGLDEAGELYLVGIGGGELYRITSRG